MARARSGLDSPILLASLVGLYPAIFHASKNWFAYTASQLLLLVVCTPLATLGLGIAAIWLTGAVERRVGGSRRVAARRGVFAALACAGLTTLLKASIFAQPERLAWIIVALMLVIALVCAVVAATGLRLLNTMILVMALAALGDWGLTYSRAHRWGYEAWYASSRSEFANVEFKKRPNVYALVMESYQSPEATKTIYDFDNQAFVDELGKRDVKVYSSYFSNYYWTLASLSSTFAMQHHYYQHAMGNGDAFGARELIGGILYNPVLDVFQRNGYRIQYILSCDYPFRAGDQLTYAFPPRTKAKVFEVYQNALLDRVLSATFTNYISSDARVDQVRSNKFKVILRRRLQVVAGGSTPHFTLLKPLATHHSPNGSTWTDLAYFELAYPESLVQNTKVFLPIVDAIIESDPEAVILMFGDHGAKRYRGFLAGRAERMHEVFASEGVPARTFALDGFGAFLGVRYPGGNPDELAPHSAVNLFRRLFASLAGDPRMLERSAADVSFFQEGEALFAAARDGRPLDAWEPATAVLAASHAAGISASPDAGDDRADGQDGHGKPTLILPRFRHGGRNLWH